MRQEAVQEERRGKYPCSIRTKVTIEDFERVKESAQIAGMSLCAYARHRLNGAHITAKYDMQVLNELRRLGGLLKMLASQGQPTGPALSELRATMKTLTTN